MSGRGQPADVENPFCTSRIQPGATPFIFPPGDSISQLVDRLREDNWWGQIIGPHGSGKSALLATITAAVERAGRRAVLVELHDGQRRLLILTQVKIKLNENDLPAAGEVYKKLKKLAPQSDELIEARELIKAAVIKRRG